MSKLKLYATSHKLNKGSTVRCDDTLFLAVMAEVVKNSHETYADYVRSVLAAVCLDRTYGDISQQGKLIEGNAYYTESDIRVYESQIETLKNQLVDCAEELKSRDISYQNLREQDQSEIARLKAQNQNQNQNQDQNQNQNQESCTESNDSAESESKLGRVYRFSKIPTPTNSTTYSIHSWNQPKSSWNKSVPSWIGIVGTWNKSNSSRGSSSRYG